MKTSKTTDCELTKFSKERKTALLVEMKKLISLSAACEYYLAALCERTDTTVSFEKFNPKELSKWSREWASHERFKKKGALQQILYSGLGMIFKANDQAIKNLSYCYIDIAQKLMFYSGDFENSRDYLQAFTDCCRDEIEGSINLERYDRFKTKEGMPAAEEHEITLNIDECLFVVKIKKSSEKKSALVYSIQPQVLNESDKRSVLYRLTMSYLKDIVGLFACALWVDTTGERADEFIEVPLLKLINNHAENSNSKVVG